jgi:Protein of unknown function (DUF3240)
MNARLPDQVLVTITSPPSLESQIVDWLLSQDDGIGFSSAAIHGHSTRHDHLSIAEQVSGRQKRIQFQIQMSGSTLDRFIEMLTADFGGADLHYWVVPVIAGGHLGLSSA